MPALGLGLWITGVMGGGGSAPAGPSLADMQALFGSGEQGFILDPLSSGVALQERTGASATTPSGDGGVTGSLKDLSPNNNWLVNNADAARPLFYTDAFVYFDGVNDHLASAALTMTIPFTHIASWRNRSLGSSFSGVFDTAVNPNTSLLTRQSSTTNHFIQGGGGSVGPIAVAINEDIVTTEIFNGVSSSLQKNDATALTGTTGASFSDPRGLTIGGNVLLSQIHELQLYRCVMINRILTAPEIASAKAWCNKTAAPLSVVGWGDSLSAIGTWYEGSGAQSMMGGVRFPRVGVVQGLAGQNSTQIKDRMVADVASPTLVQVLWAGRNDINNGAQTVASSTILTNVALMVAAAQARSNKYVVVSVTNGNIDAGALLANSEASGTAIHTALISLNSTLASTYGANFLDLRALLVAKGLTGDANDQADAAADVPPRSLMVDDVHYNAAGNAFIGRQIEVKMQALGY